MHITKARWDIEKKDEWEKWVDEIPFMKFRDDWEVKVVPPLSGTVVRMIVRKGGQKGRVSVYLDCYSRLACFSEGNAFVPYWEVYPFEGDLGRCGIHDTEKLMSMIEQGLSEIE